MNSLGVRGMLPLGPAPKPFVERKSNFYVDVEEEDFDYSKYPASISSIYPSVTSPAQCQAFLRLNTNFSSQTDCDLFEVSEEACGVWTTFKDDELLKYLDHSKTIAKAPYLRVLFLYLEDSRESSFSCRPSLKQNTATKMLNTLAVNPHFVQFMLGKPDHLAPFSNHQVNLDGRFRHEYMSQFPRWHIRNPKRENPCSMYLSYDEGTKSTTYILVSGKDDPVVKKARKTLDDSFGLATTIENFLQAQVDDPFLLSSIICRESLLDAEGVIRKLRMDLYNQLDVVDTYANNPFNRDSLKQVTNALHRISQDCESLFASAEMLAMVIRTMTRANQTIVDMTNGINPGNLRVLRANRTDDSLAYLSEAIEAQKRWIRSYISRKEVAMNLVYQLVMQQDSETNTSIAKATRDDSNIMKVIAIVTIVFLPPTVVTSFFGMTFFNTLEDGSYVVNSRWWIFWIISVPLTFAVLFAAYVWWKWPEIRVWVSRVETKLRSRRSRRGNGTRGLPDVEVGFVEETLGMPQRSAEVEMVVSETIIELKGK